MKDLANQFRFPDGDDPDNGDGDGDGTGSTSGGGSGDIIKPPGDNQPDTTQST